MERGALIPWTGDDFFQRSLDQLVLQPFAEPKLFDNSLNPLRRLVIVYGRPGVGKKEALVEYCTRIALPHGVVSVDFAQTSKAIEAIDTIVNQQARMIEEIDDALELSELRPINHAIIVDHFDRLIFEPDNERTMLFMLRLSKMAVDYNFMLIGLSDRLASEEAHQSNLQQTTRMYRHAVFEQFRAKTYLPAPHALYRTALFKDLITRFAASLVSKGKDVIVSLTEGDYIKLADFSAYATVDDIVGFTRALFYDIASNDPPVLCRPADALIDPATGKPTGPVCIDMNVVESYMSSGTGTPHILSYDPRNVENLYSVQCGRGPIVGMKPANRPSIPHDFSPVAAAAASDAPPKTKKHSKRGRTEEEAVWEAEK